jgi:OOP family OmpA-OmpF porin
VQFAAQFVMATIDTHQAAAEQLEQIRTLLFSHERHELTAIKAQLFEQERFTAAVADVVAEALAERARRDPVLERILEPSIENAIQSSIEKEPHRFAEILFPILGPSLRKAIEAIIHGMFVNFNQLLEQSLSIRALRWRLEAWRTDEPFAKIALLHTLVYQVEQIFLVHRETGLVLHHVKRADAIVQDPDMVSGMLTAIQSFVADSFSVSSTDKLRSMTYGDLELILYQGPYATLAAAVRGRYPVQLNHCLATTIETLHIRYGSIFKKFQGDSQSLPDLQPLLANCLLQQTQKKTEQDKYPRLALMILSGFLIAMIIVLALWINQVWSTETKRAELIAQLQHEPGYVVFATRTLDDQWLVSGLRDPLARPDTDVLSAQLRQDTDYHAIWQPFYSLDPSLIQQRILDRLHLPKSVCAHWPSPHHLELSGTATPAWLAQAQRKLATIPDVHELNTQALKLEITDQERTWQQIVDALRAEPGYVVIEAHQGDDDSSYFLKGLQDPFARKPWEIIGTASLDRLPLQMHWVPYTSEEPALVIKRAHKKIAFPATVTADLQDGVLTLNGSSDQRWVKRAVKQLVTVPGVNSVNAEKVTPLEQDVNAFTAAIQTIEAWTVHFQIGQWHVPIDAAFVESRNRLVTEVRRLLDLAAAIDREVMIVVLGLTDPIGDHNYNQFLRDKRALFVVDQLLHAGIPREALTWNTQDITLSAPTTMTDAAPDLRKVVLKVRFIN